MQAEVTGHAKKSAAKTSTPLMSTGLEAVSDIRRFVSSRVESWRVARRWEHNKQEEKIMGDKQRAPGHQEAEWMRGGSEVDGGSAGGREYDDQGMATVEYALVTVAAAGFAGLLIVLLKSSEVRELLMGILQRALGG